MSLQPGDHITDIPENTADVMNSHTGDIENANIEFIYYNSVQSSSTSSQHCDEQRPRIDLSAPPSYEDCTDLSKLPSYEEVFPERCLRREMSMRMLGSVVQGPPNVELLPPEVPASTIITVDAPYQSEIDIKLLGTNNMFCLAFLVTFIFNWFGFLFLMFICQTVAARYGALSGFGLSVAKWLMILKLDIEISESIPENHPSTWLWWSAIALGYILCICAIIKYLHIKRRWSLLSVPEKAQLLYFY